MRNSWNAWFLVGIYLSISIITYITNDSSHLRYFVEGNLLSKIAFFTILGAYLALIIRNGLAAVAVFFGLVVLASFIDFLVVSGFVLKFDFEELLKDLVINIFISVSGLFGHGVFYVLRDSIKKGMIRK